MPDAPTISELFKGKAVTNEQVNAAAEAYLNDVSREAYELAPAVTIDLSNVLGKHEPARRALADPEASLAIRREMVRTAILLGSEPNQAVSGAVVL